MGVLIAIYQGNFHIKDNGLKYLVVADFDKLRFFCENRHRIAQNRQIPKKLVVLKLQDFANS